MSLENVSRTFIGSVVCIDLVGYSTKSVAQQIAIKETFTRLLANALQRVPEEERIILDTGDGAAVSFLGDPEQGLALGLALRDASASHATELGAARGQGAVRIGINLGPMKVALDLNGYPRIVGDGINVAEKIAAFAQPGEIVVAHSFHDMVSRLSDANAKLFRAAGTATDKNGREHEIYVVDKSGSRSSRATRTGTVPAAPALSPTTAEPAAAALPATGAQADSPPPGALAGFLRDRLKVGFVATLLLALIAAEAVILLRDRSPAPAPVAVAPVPAPPPAKLEPAPPKAVPAPLKAVPAPEKAAPKTVEPEAKKVPEPIKPAAPAAKAPEPPPTPPEAAPKAPPPQAAAKPEARPEPRPREPAKPAKREETAKAVIAPQPAPAPVPPPPEPREEPKPAPPPPNPVATPIARAAVNFPPAAAARNIDAGTVKARLTIDAAGRVKEVQVLESRPRRYFDEEAARSLREWRFNPGADNRSYDVEIAFQR